MTNAFTAKPDLSKFFKEARHAQNSAKTGRQARDNPTNEQRALFFSIITPKPKHEARSSNN